MDQVMGGLSPGLFALALGVTMFAGFVKGAVGFAMPMIMISVLSSILPPEAALAALILPTLFTNVVQAFRHGLRAFWATVVGWRRYLGVTVVALVISAQFVDAIPQGWFLFALGLPITLFALVRLLGVPLAVKGANRGRLEIGSAMVGGLYGGVSGVWGPPLMVYLISIGAAKAETVRVQGVVFLIGAFVLLGAHLQSGVLNAITLPFSAILALPALAGLWLGTVVQDRLDQDRFSKWTQVLLILTGLNLMRRAIGW
ncbi:MAG: sulfite exporter TauE/SafE family protein [Paracoccaceae bacterium]